MSRLMENIDMGSLALPLALVALGLVMVWRGLGGGRSGERGLLRSQQGMLGRIEGFRLMMFGLVLIGSGAALAADARWLLLLSLGIGFVEILESSALIAVWKWDRRLNRGLSGS